MGALEEGKEDRERFSHELVAWSYSKVTSTGGVLGVQTTNSDG